MVIVQAGNLGLPPVIIGQLTVFPIETTHLIDFLAKVDDGLASYGMSHEGIDVQGVAWQVDSQVAMMDTETVGIDDPGQRGFRGVNGCGIAEEDIQTGLGETGAIDFCRLFVEVDAFRR